MLVVLVQNLDREVVSVGGNHLFLKRGVNPSSILKRLSNKTCLTSPHQEYQFWNDESVRVWDMNDLNKRGFQGLTIPVK